MFLKSVLSILELMGDLDVLAGDGRGTGGGGDEGDRRGILGFLGQGMEDEKKKNCKKK